MALPDPEMVLKEMDKLKKFTDQQLIMIALAELIMSCKEVPPGPRVVLSTTLMGRAGALVRQEQE